MEEKQHRRSINRSKFLTQNIAPIRMTKMKLTYIEPSKSTGKISKRFLMNIEDFGLPEITDIQESATNRRDTFYDFDIGIPEDSPIKYKPNRLFSI